MITTSPGKIFLSDNRKLIENQHCRKYSSLANSLPANGEESLYKFDDEMLAPKASNGFYTTQQGYLIIIPITGTVHYFDDQENETDIEVNEGLMIFLEKNTFVKLTNPFDDDVINYLAVGITHKQVEPNSPAFLTVNLQTPNHLHVLTTASVPFKITIGQFNGRGNCVYTAATNTKFYAFVLAGAFEIEGRLLHDRDGVALWSVEEIEIEALSNYATIITLQVPC